MVECSSTETLCSTRLQPANSVVGVTVVILIQALRLESYETEIVRCEAVGKVKYIFRYHRTGYDSDNMRNMQIYTLSTFARVVKLRRTLGYLSRFANVLGTHHEFHSVWICSTNTGLVPSNGVSPSSTATHDSTRSHTARRSPQLKPGQGPKATCGTRRNARCPPTGTAPEFQRTRGKGATHVRVRPPPSKRSP